MLQLNTSLSVLSQLPPTLSDNFCNLEAKYTLEAAKLQMPADGSSREPTELHYPENQGDGEKRPFRHHHLRLGCELTQ